MAVCQTFVRGLRYCLLDFFATHRLSHLCVVELPRAPHVPTGATEGAAQRSGAAKRGRAGEALNSHEASASGHPFMAAARQQASALSADDLEWLLARPSVSADAAARVRRLEGDAQREQVAQWLKYAGVCASVVWCGCLYVAPAGI